MLFRACIILFIFPLSSRCGEIHGEIIHISTSPNGAIQVQVRPTTHDKKTGEDLARLEIINSKSGRVLTSWKTIYPSHLKDARWSDDSKFMAINDRQGNCGDTLYIVRIINGKANIIRKPSEEKVESLLKASHSNWGNFNKITVNATRWLDQHHLELHVYGNSLTWPKDTEHPSLFLYFDEVWILSVEPLQYKRIKSKDEVFEAEK